MKKALIFLLLVGMIFLIACKGQEIVCNKPYIQVAASCCLDENGNNICDLDEKIVRADETTTTILGTPTTTTTTTTMGVTTTSLKIAWAGQEGVTTLGEENSPVKIVFYGDFGSELTRRFYDQILMYKFKTDFIDTGNAYFSYNHYLFSNTDEGKNAAEALECAADQGRFYGMMSLLAKNPDFMNVEDLKENARKLDLERGVFANCLDSGRYKNKIDESNKEAVALGGGKAPLITINGVVYDNAALLSYYDFKKLVNTELERLGKEPVVR